MLNTLGMRKALSGLLVFGLLLAPTQFLNASTIKTGSACTKFGQIQVVNGYKFTCIKSGKKLIWDKGLAIKNTLPMPTPTITPTPSHTPSPTQIYNVNDLSLDTRITKVTEFSNPNICKTVDSSFTPNVSNGFPRPEKALFSPKSANVLVLPVNFSDFLFTDSDLIKLQNATNETTSIYKKISFGKFDLKFTYPSKDLWVTLPKKTLDYGLVEIKPQQNTQDIVEEIFSRVSPKLDFNLYDAVILETGYFNSTGGGSAFPGQTFKTPNGLARGVSFESGISAGMYQVIEHELGHALFGLEDLYIFLNNTRPTVSDPTPAGEWDMMSGSDDEFFAWSKLLMGLLGDNEFHCLTNQKYSVHYLANIDSVEQNKAIFINLAPGHTLAIESRTNENSVQGVLVYEIDTKINHGDGPIKAQKKLLDHNSSIEILGWKILVLENSSTGALVSVEKLNQSAPSASSTPSANPIPSPSQDLNNQNTADNLLEKPCQKLAEEKTTFYLWVCTNVKDKGLIWIRKGTESQYEIVKS